MARNVSFMPSTTSAKDDRLDLEDIPQEIRNECEEIYAALKSNPNGRMRAEFSTVAELKVYIAQVTAYCVQRPDGPIRFRKSPTRNLPANVMDFRITDIPVEREAETAEIRRLAEEAKAKAKATPAAMPSRGVTSKRR